MANSDGADNYGFSVIGTDNAPFVGYISDKDPTTVTELAMVRGSQNVLKTLSGTIANRCGRKLFDAVDATEDGVVASFDWDTSTGPTFLMRVLASGKLQAYINNVWTSLLTGLTNTRFTFDTWWDNTQKLDKLLMANGDENIKSWTGGNAKFDSAVRTATGAIWGIKSGVSLGGTFSVGMVLTIPGGTGGTITITDTSTSPLSTIFPAFTLTAQGSGYAPGTYTASTTSGPFASIEVIITEVRTIYSVTKQGTSFYGEERFENASQDDASTISSNTISVSDTDNRVIINGGEYAYFGGVGTTTLTGVAGATDSTLDPTTAVVGSNILQAIVITTSPETDFLCDVVRVLQNQLFVLSYTNRTVYISSDDDFTDFVNGGSYVQGDPDLVVLDEMPKGMVPKENSMYIAAGDRDWYVVTPNVIPPVSFSSATGTRYIITQVDKKRGASKTAALGHEFIDTIGDDIIYLDQNNQLRSFGTFRALFTPKFPSLSQAVRQELADEDFTGGQVRAVDDYIYIVAPLSGKVYLRQARDLVADDGNVVAERLWHPPQTWNIATIAIYQGQTYGYSASNPQLYQLWDTGQWHDDTPSGNAQYISIMRMAYRHFADGNGEKRYRVGSFDKAYFEGYILNHSDLVAHFLYDYQAAEDYQEKVLSDINNTAVLYGGDGVIKIGGEIVGNTTLGGGIRDANYANPLPKFRAIANMSPSDCFEYQIELVSEALDSRWEILCLGTDAGLSTNYPVQIQLPY